MLRLKRFPGLQEPLGKSWEPQKKNKKYQTLCYPHLSIQALKFATKSIFSFYRINENA